MGGVHRRLGQEANAGREDARKGVVCAPLPITCWSGLGNDDAYSELGIARIRRVIAVGAVLSVVAF